MSSQWDESVPPPEPPPVVEPPPIIRPPVSLDAPPPAPAVGFDVDLPASASAARWLPATPLWLSALIFCFVAAAVVGAVRVGLMYWSATRPSLEILPMNVLGVREHQTLSLTIPVGFSG